MGTVEAANRHGFGHVHSETASTGTTWTWTSPPASKSPMPLHHATEILHSMRPSRGLSRVRLIAIPSFSTTAALEHGTSEFLTSKADIRIIAASVSVSVSNTLGRFEPHLHSTSLPSPSRAEQGIGTAPIAIITSALVPSLGSTLIQSQHLGNIARDRA